MLMTIASKDLCHLFSFSQMLHVRALYNSESFHIFFGYAYNVIYLVRF